MENVYEAFFFLKYSGGWSFSEAYNLPVKLREWFIKRLLKQLESEKEAIENASKGTANATELTPHNSPQMPSNMQNFMSKGPG
tara:strand:+ start:205 stop:453 length:249 start_codon:yes stop_codon:yes gene_type:complete